MGRHTALALALDQAEELAFGLADVGLLLAQRRVVEAEDVVPGGHAHAPVDGHRTHGRRGEHEAQERGRELRHDRVEIVVGRAEAVHPDDGAPLHLGRLDLERVQHSSSLADGR
jgi:hypothetical protein